MANNQYHQPGYGHSIIRGFVALILGIAAWHHIDERQAEIDAEKTPPEPGMLVKADGSVIATDTLDMQVSSSALQDEIVMKLFEALLDGSRLIYDADANPEQHYANLARVEALEKRLELECKTPKSDIQALRSDLHSKTNAIARYENAEKNTTVKIPANDLKKLLDDYNLYFRGLATLGAEERAAFTARTESFKTKMQESGCTEKQIEDAINFARLAAGKNLQQLSGGNIPPSPAASTPQDSGAVIVPAAAK